MAEAASIPEDRPLTDAEAALVRWMLKHGTDSAVEFLPQLATTRVVSRCRCGCASVNFAVAGVISPPCEGIVILADFEYRTAEGYLCGVFVFERAGVSQLQPLVYSQ